MCKDSKDSKSAKSVNFIVEVISVDDENRLYVIRNVGTGQPIKVLTDPSEVARFFYEFEF